MSDFIVSARKYRPATFDTVVGQAHITNTLKNAIKTQHLAQAFLFCGPRGVGKTTCARILAKTINCFNRTEGIEACDTCESCNSFNEGSSHNVFELDAASNNSVDDIRNLTDQVRYAPQLGTHKVYIIDEVHMLSTNAFNAFLKTLEEPPKHAIFILATTEKHKIIPTILSRCQIFDFNRIQVKDISNHLAFIADKEGVTAEEEGLNIIAQKADGALRDACSIFDQLVSFAGNNITYKAVIENLNILDYDYYFKVTDALLAENISNALLLFNEILNNGFDGHEFIAGMSSHYRNLLVSKDATTLQLLEVSDSIKLKYKTQAEQSSLMFLIKGLSMFNKTDIGYKTSKNKRLHVELSLIQLCSFNALKAEAEKKKDIVEQSASTEVQEAKPKVIAQPINDRPNTVIEQTNTLEVTPALNPSIEEKVVSKQEIVKTQKIETSVPAVKRPAIKLATPSINPFAKSKVEEDKNEAATIEAKEQAKTGFTQEELNSVWTAYANGLKEKGKFNVGSVLLSKSPVMKDDFKLEFTISNKAVEEAINEDKSDFLGFLRNELNNFSVQLELLMVAEDGEKKLYTAKDKYDYLAEKNPAIHQLRKVFDLDVQF